MTDWYAILGVSPEADEKTIRQAFRRLVRRYHPDAGEGSSAEKLRQVIEAYRTLIDPERRRAYDRSLARQSTPRGVRITPVFMRRGDPVPGPPPAARSGVRFSVPYPWRRPPTVWDLVEDLFRAIEEDFRFHPFFRRR